jgi:threonylcarbamoyladenosine tRNA methylthiotransferase MtaB
MGKPTLPPTPPRLSIQIHRLPLMRITENSRTEFMPANTEKPRRAALHTLGCRLNQSETNHIRDQLVEQGYTIVPFEEEADLAIINTCTVTRLADAKSRSAIRQFTRRNPDAITAVVGCYSQMGYKEISQIEGVDLIIGNQEKQNVLDYLGDAKSETPVIVRDRIDQDDFSVSLVGDLPFSQRANLKIQDGCDFMCTFCIIPFARGRARSREYKNLVDEASNLVERGVRELILTGVNLGTYDHSGHTITDITDALDELPGLSRIRISSIEPTTIPKELFPRMADPGHALQPYLHIPLQSGTDPILQAMRRKYSLQEYLLFLKLAQSEVPDLCIGTDILVGFPGETDGLFQETCQTFLEAPFAYCHTFTYSERDGTPSTKLPGNVPIPERKVRSAHLRRLSAKKRHDYYEARLGNTYPVLFENKREGHWPGYTPNYIRTLVPDNGLDLANRMGLVRLDQIAADFVEGTLECLLDE